MTRVNPDEIPEPVELSERHTDPAYRPEDECLPTGEISVDQWQEVTSGGGPGRDGVYVSVLIGDHPGHSFEVRDSLLLGRGSDTDVKLQATDVSRHHARIYNDGQHGFIIEDLASRNGTRVNGELITKQRLTFGDRIWVGAHNVLLFAYRDRRQERLLEARKMESLGRLAGGIAHDFNNILSAIVSNIGLVQELVQEIERPVPQLVECLADVQKAAERGSGLVSQLLGFARRSPYQERPVDLAALLQEVQRLVSRTFDRDIAVSAECSQGVMVVADPVQLHQALLNLCINARDAMPNGGQLQLSVQVIERDDPKTHPEVAGRHVLITVRDSGVGMSQEVRDRLFEPFFSTKEVGQGTGLGLSVVYGVVKNHNGKVWAESIPGEGSVFSIALPGDALLDLIFTDPGEGGSHHEASAPPEDVKTVLVVDDEVVVRDSIRRILQRRGFRVMCAEDGVAALEVFREIKQELALVVLDLMMPRLSGEKTVAELQRELPGVRILIISGFQGDGKREKLEQLGVAGYLPKPFTMQQLEEAVQAAIAPPENAS